MGKMRTVVNINKLAYLARSRRADDLSLAAAC
jgi:hypothetical protein